MNERKMRRIGLEINRWLRFRAFVNGLIRTRKQRRDGVHFFSRIRQTGKLFTGRLGIADRQKIRSPWLFCGAEVQRKAERRRYRKRDILDPILRRIIWRWQRS